MLAEPVVEGETSALVEGRHRLLERIARGAMGEVYVALHVPSGRRVALKRMRREAIAQPSAIDHFRAEYRALRALEHPRIIEVYHYGYDAELPYYTMELLDGEDLRKLAPLPYREACRYLRDVASSLALLHARRLLHRDLSPRNVRRTSDGRCKLIDFGTMAPFGEPPNVAGTAPFLPPEALRGDPLDQRADLYALGALAYWLLTGHHAHDARSFDELPSSWAKQPPRTRRHDDAIPQRLDDLVLSLLEPNPMGRPSSAAEVIERLGSFVDPQTDESLAVARSYLAKTALVGRSRQQARVERRAERTSVGRGSALYVHSLPGVGKSRLLLDAEIIAQTHGLATVTARARQLPGERSVARALGCALLESTPLEAREAMAADRAELDAFLGDTTGRPHAALGLEARATLQSALARWFTSVAALRPLLIGVDDLDRADEFSVSFMGALAVEAQRVPMLVIATGSDDDEAIRVPIFEAFTQLADHVQLAPLDEADTHELVASSFGAAPNSDRVASWVFRNARGNPAMSIELIRHLVDQGLASYVAGAWVLPEVEITTEVPQELRRALALGLSRLSRDARALAELLAVHLDSAAIGLIEAASGLDGARVHAAIDELLERDVLVQEAGHYNFSLHAMRDAVLLGLEPRRKRELHTGLAAALLEDAGQDMERRLWGGWHLSHTVEELRGARILAEAGPRMLRSGVSTHAAAAAMERALEIYERHDGPLSARLRLRSFLTLAGYLCDHELAERYGQDTVLALYEATGFARAERWSRHLGGRLAVWASILWTNVERLFKPASRRPPTTPQALLYFGRALVALMGVRTTLLDAPSTTALAKLARPMAMSGLPGASETALACEAFALQPQGREAELRRKLDEALTKLEKLDPRFVPGMTATDHEDMHVGLLLATGLNESYLPGAGALAFADRIDALGTPLSTICAERVRMVYYAVRGQRDQAESSRRLIELHGIQGGSTWQVNAFSQPIEGMCGALHGDVVATRRALDQLEKLVESSPALVPMRDQVRAAYHYARGDYERSAEEGLAFVARHPPRSIIGWGAVYATAVSALTELGRHQEARELAERAVAACPDEDRRYFAMYLALEASLAIALGMTGEPARAAELFATLEARLRAEGEATVLALLHEYRARLARMGGDLHGLLDSLAAMSEAAHVSRSAALIAHVDRIAGISTRMTIGSDPPRVTSDAGHSSAETVVRTQREAALVTRILAGCDGADERANQALHLLAQCAGAERGFLILRERSGSKLAARLEPRDPPEALERTMVRLLEDGRAGTQRRVTVVDADDGRATERSFLLVMLRGRQPDTCGAVVALEEHDDALLRLRSALIDQVGHGLAGP